MEKVIVSKDMTIKLPNEFKGLFAEGDELFVSVAANSLRLRKKTSEDLLDKASSFKDKNAPSSHEISRIIHQIRKLDEGCH